MLRAVVETAVDGVILIDADGTVQMFNPACEQLFGFAADEVIGQNVKMLMPAHFSDAHDGYIANYLATGDRKIIGIGREVEGQRRDGTIFPMDLSVGESKRNGTTHFVGIIRDLTERRRSDRAIREAVARLETVVETAVDGVILIDADGTVQMFNPACERLFEFEAAEVIGRNVKMLMPAHFRDEHDRYIANYLATGARKIIGIGREVEGQRKNGTVFPMDLSVGEAQQDGAPVFVGIIHDLTERKKAEVQLAHAQKMEVVGQLSGGVAHDFNNLLTVVMGNAELLGLSLRARPDLHELADGIMRAGERGAELTRRLLAFSRKQYLRPARLDLNHLIGELRALLRATLRANIHVDLKLADNLHAGLVDPAQIEAALLNLCLNAQDAMPDGGNLSLSTANITLDSSYRERNLEVPPGDYAVIAVTDTGEGMPPDVLARVFEPFFTTKEVGKGSGLGLSMVYGFVKQSGGHVSIYSEPGLGTTVRIYLPTAEGHRAAPSAQADRPGILPARNNETVLIVEDDPMVRSFAVTCVRAFGYRAIAAGSGDEALGLLSEDSGVDVLFTDIVMPGGVNGWDLAERARARDPDLRVIYSSGYAIETLTARNRMPEGAIFLNKPYRRVELARCLHEVISAAAEGNAKES
ncbi:PAS domain S-box protein [Pararhodobacter sp. SW119]|uniref:hybrid sensor histidine kinase/response regulator n=1 Tax=Pararhodobacter sp. SW119 TaxID=2780075 RepID=UPI001AE0BC34|nr:PAS domain S-box protein [Pararhodobacter sp. SW119]